MRWPLAGRSLRWRLTLAGAGAIVIAILGAALGLALLFERHVERVAAADLEARIHAIAARVETGTDGRPVLRPVEIDPLYTRPFSGHYWQIELDGQRMRSRSLWDHVLIWPEGAADQGPGDGQARRVDLTGPMGEPLLAREARFAVGPAAVPLRILVATDREDLEAARRGFLGDLVPVLGVLGVLLGIGSWVQLRMGLGPLADLSARVAGLRIGRRRGWAATCRPKFCRSRKKSICCWMHGPPIWIGRGIARRIWRMGSRPRFRRCLAMRMSCAPWALRTWPKVWSGWRPRCGRSWTAN